MIGVQQIFDGLALGGIYALAALGLAIIYRFLGFMQLSHGQLVTLGAYVGLFMARLMPSLWLVLPVTILVRPRRAAQRHH